jgi:hypothetical protein
MEEISIGTGLTLSGGILNNSATPTPTGYYGAFQDDTTQTVVSINTAYSVKLNTVDLSNGVSVVNDGSGNPTRITLANTGIYNIQFSLQLEKTGGSGNMIVDIWVRKNNVDIPATTGKVVLTGSANASPVIAAWNYVLDLAAGDYIQLMWATSNDNVVIKAVAATSPHPSIPSAILTVTQQSGIMAGTGITAINSLTGAAQTLTTGTTGTDFAIVDSGTDHKFNLPVASATNTGKLSSTDWTTFNNKLPYTGATGNVDLGANSLFTAILGVGISSSLSATAHVRGSSPSVGSSFLVQNSTPVNLFNVLNNGFVGIGTNTPVSLLHIGTGASTTLGDFNTPVITFNSVNNGIYLDSNKLFFKAAGAFNFGVDSTGVLGTQFRINGGSNNLLTPVFVPYRLNAAGLASGFGGNSAGDISLITSSTNVLTLYANTNIGIGTTTNPPLAKLSINHQTSYNGSLAVSPVNSRVALIGNIEFTNTTTGGSWTGQSINAEGTNRTFRFYGSGNLNVADTSTFIFTSAYGGRVTSYDAFTFTSTFQPTSGTAVHNMFNITGLINQTGTATGITRGLLINPTLSATDYRGLEVITRNNANDSIIKLNNGATDLFVVKGDSKIGFFGATPVVKQTLGAATAGMVYSTTEQTMLQNVYNLLKAFGLG